MNNSQYDIAIIGGGAVGCAIAYELSKTTATIVLLERETDVCLGTSGRNSGVSHAGFNNRPGSLMARLCVEGNKGMEEACRTLKVPFRRIGKLVVGFDEDDRSTLERLYENGQANGSIGLSLVGEDEIHKLAPNIGGTCALKSENTGVFNPFLYTIHLAEIAQANGVDILLGHEVTAIGRAADGLFAITTSKATVRATVVINAAGLFSDEIAAMAGDDRYKIYPCRGEYCIVDKKDPSIPDVLVYPAPKKGVGGLGVHLTTTIDGTMLLGPSATYIDNKDDNGTTAEVTAQLLAEAAELLPGLDARSVIGQYAGVRPKIVQKGEANFGDFIIEESSEVDGLINLVGIESPGLTASLPIARMVCDIVTGIIPLEANHSFSGEYVGKILLRDMDEEQQNEAIRSNPNYGRMICRCEKVTLGDVEAALQNPLGAHGVVAVKNRTRATMGRCQGGHCLVRIVEHMLKEGFGSPNDLYFRWEEEPMFNGSLK